MSVPGADAPEQFADRARRHGVIVHSAPSKADIPAVAASIIRIVQGKIAIVAPDLGDLRGEVADALSTDGVEVLMDGDAREMARADVGISRVRMGIAETGSVVVVGNDVVSRLATMLPLVHVAVLDAGAVVPSLDDVAPLLRAAASGLERDRPEYVSIVTGASRTADIEKVLTVGVQGPREVHVILVGGDRIL